MPKMENETSLLGRQWCLLPQASLDEGVCREVEGLHPVLRTLLAQRGFCEGEAISGFLYPKLRHLSDPFELPEMGTAVERIFKAVDGGERICIFGDYDVDGISSITILKTVLEAYGAEPRCFIPVRSKEGYGLSQAAVERCLAEGPRPELIITVDCGTVSNEPIEQLQAEGVDVIVVDHHEGNVRGRPCCVSLVNPKASPTGLEYLCAAGVVFKLAHAMLKARPLERLDLKDLLDLVAVATISDIVPLVGENRLLVRHGLRRIEQTRKWGLRALLEVTHLEGHLTSSDVGFRIGPRINAAGRMDRPGDALDALLAQSNSEARKLAQRLDNHNRQRQKVEQRILEEAEEKLRKSFDPGRDPVIVVGSQSWHPGVVGIVASRLMRRYHRPAFVVAIDRQGLGKGSGRSIEGLSLVDAINHSRHLLEAGGGHHMAAGISIREQNLSAFREHFAEYVREVLPPEALVPRLKLDAELSLADLTMDFLVQYELLQPFGPSNPAPTFFARDVWLTEAPRHLRNHHLKLYLRQHHEDREAMFFGGGVHDLPAPPWDIAYTIDRNVFRGRTSLQITIKDLRPAQLGGP